MATLINKAPNRKNILLPLCGNSIRSHLLELKIEESIHIDVFSTLSSTSDYLSQTYFTKQRESNAYHLCLAEEQTAGRGRFGHQWWSPAGVNLYLSLYCPHVRWRKEYDALSLWCLIALTELLERHGVNNIQLKWPNDICSDNKKLGGILIERKSEQIIIGVGLNVAMSSLETDCSFPSVNSWVDLLMLHPDWCMNRNELAANVFKVLQETLHGLESNSLHNLENSWAKHDAMLGKKVKFTYQEKPCHGTMCGIDEEGLAKIKIDEKILHLHSAHVCDIKL